MSKEIVIRRKTVRDVAQAKNGTPLVCVTAYTAPMARAADDHADVILVGDSLGMVLYGFDSTLPVTLEMMEVHGAAVVRSTKKAMIIVDMPFGSYQESPEQAFRNAARLMANTGCAGVKLEGGAEMAQTVSFLTQRGVPVMGHIGLQPQSVHGAGGYRVTGRAQEEAKKILTGAKDLAQAGAFAIVLECIDPDLAAAITAAITAPTIGIGASAACDGQILVSEDLLGATGEQPPKFVKQFADLFSTADKAMAQYAADVRSRRFPGEENIYSSGGKAIRAKG